MNIFGWLVNLHFLLVALVVFRLLTRDALAPVTRLCWIIITAFAPIAGVVAYLLVGETRRGLRTDMRIKYMLRRIKGLKTPVLGDMELLEKHVEEIYRPAFRYAHSINGFGPTIGNVPQLLVEEDEGISRLVADIDAAKNKVFVLTYIWLSDKTGGSVAEALIRAARRGLDVRAVADGLGSRHFVHGELWQRMKEAGVKVLIAQPFPNIIKTILFSRVDLRNHRKIVVIDSHITYSGSRNMADADYSVKPKFAPWVDIVVRFEGPIAVQNQVLFGSDWLLQQSSGAITEFVDECEPATRKGERGVLAQVWADGPTERDNATPQMFNTLMNCARESITITTPYFVPSESVVSTLCAAALRGVKVNLIMPRRNDSWVVAAASHSYYRRLLEAGVNLHEYIGGLLHSKIITVDGTVCMIGSSNLDLRSFDLNYENNILFHDVDLTGKIEERQREYLAGSEPVVLGEVLNWPLHRRIWSNVIATIGPVL